MTPTREDYSPRILSRVYNRQVHMLYSRQMLAVISIATVLACLFFYMSASDGWELMTDWVVMHAIILSFRVVATLVYFRLYRKQQVNMKLAEVVYIIGVLLSALVWAAMMFYLYSNASLGSRVLLFVAIIGIAGASHTTLGYRKLPIYIFITALLLPSSYAVLHEGFPHPQALSIAVLFYMAFMLRSASLFYNSFYEMMCLQEESTEREYKLTLQREKAEMANKAKSEFLSRMSHELRTPLNAVLGLNELQMMDAQNPLSGRQQERSVKIKDAGNHLLSLVNDVLDFSRIETGSLRVNLTSLDCQALVRNAFKLIDARASERNIVIYFEASPEPIWVTADRQRLKQVLVNLLDNAVKYNREGGTVTVSLSATENNNWRISVIDTGYGISESQISELFKPFARLDATNKGVDGTGIGLSFSKQLVRLMHGEIGVDSRIGQGSCFWVELPAAEPQSATEEDDNAEEELIDRHVDNRPATPVVKGRRVLLVEDNIVNQEVAVDMLEEMGFDVDVASNGDDALTYLKNEKVSLILMDCEMPVMDGMTATRLLREREQQKHVPATPVIALTAHAIQGAKEQCFASGMDDFLSKPFSYNELQRILQKWVSFPHHSEFQTDNNGDAKFIFQGSELNNDSIINFTVLGQLRTRKSNLIDKVVGLYLEESPRVLNEINNAAAEGDTAELSAIVHRFKSSSRTVGADRLADACWQIELSSDRHEIDQKSIEQLAELYAEARAMLKQILDKKTIDVDS